MDMIDAFHYIDKWIKKNGPFEGDGRQYEDGDMIEFAEDYARTIIKAKERKLRRVMYNITSQDGTQLNVVEWDDIKKILNK